MINLDLSTLIDRPMKDVFSFVSNPNHMSKWNSAVVSVQQTTPGPVQAGTKFKSIGEALGRRIEGELQVVAYEPDHKCGFQMEAGPVTLHLTLTLSPVGTGTKLNLNAQGNPGGLFKLAEGMMAGRVKSLMDENLARLKSVLEKGS